MGKVPALEDGEVRLADSAAICMYLADRYSLGDLAPQLEAPQRGRYLYWMTYTPGVIEPAMAEKFANREANRFANGWGDYDAMLEVLTEGVGEGPWVLGDRFTAADVMLGSSTIFMRTFGVLPEGSPLNGYADRCEQRQGYRTAAALDAD